MNDIGLVSIRQEAKKLYADEIQRHKNYLNQEFDPDAPNQVWVSDVTILNATENRIIFVLSSTCMHEKSLLIK